MMMCVHLHSIMHHHAACLGLRRHGHTDRAFRGAIHARSQQRRRDHHFLLGFPPFHHIIAFSYAYCATSEDEYVYIYILIGFSSIVVFL